MKETAQGFYEGALSNRMLGPAGGLMLREHSEAPAPSPAQAQPQPAGSVTHSFDLAGMKEAVRAAITQAVANAPSSGYASPQEALQGVRTALGSSDPRLGDYVDRRSHSIGQRVYSESRNKTHPAAPTVNVHVSADKPTTPPKSKPEGDRS